jgi:putative transposase
MVGRILRYLKMSGHLAEPLRAIARRTRRMVRPHATRKPREYTARAPDDLIQIDTMELRPVPGAILQHFTAHGVVSRYNLAMIRSRATTPTARDFLAYLQQAFPVPIQAIQVDGGSEFMAAFEAA